jgi:hypothetical protein
MTIEQLYERTIRLLPTAERLRRATLILEGIPPEAVADFSDEWSDEDLADFNSGWSRIPELHNWGDLELPQEEHLRHHETG